MKTHNESIEQDLIDSVEADEWIPVASADDACAALLDAANGTKVRTHG